MDDRIVRNLKLGEERKHFEILNLCFNPWGTEERWKRFYSQEEFEAPQNVLVVEEDGKWIGGVTAWFREAFLKHDKKVKVCIAGDGYVHPEHRGKGVYSTFMRAVNKLGQERRASLGMGFISLFDVPFIALPKYGYTDVFYPTTRILVLHPKRFLNFLIKELENAELPRKFDGLRVKLTVSFKSPKGRHMISEIFKLKNGKLSKVAALSPNETSRKIDLQIYADIETLMKTFERFFLRKKTLFPFLVLDIFRRRLKIRFSFKFLKAYMGL